MEKPKALLEYFQPKGASFYFPLVPMGKPRMTRRDKWMKREVVTRYWAWKDELLLMAKKFDYKMGNCLMVCFELPMPQSWSAKKRERMNGVVHQVKPDTDNMTKAFMDAFNKNDQEVWGNLIVKRWSEKGGIIVIQ